MKVFREIGRQVEQFKAKEKFAAEEDTVSQCENCGARFSKQHTQCPECKSGGVRRSNQQK